jgi:hypothetical protein
MEGEKPIRCPAAAITLTQVAEGELRSFGAVFLAVCSRAWGVGVRHYRSTGS